MNYIELNKPFTEEYYTGYFVSSTCMATVEPVDTWAQGNGAVGNRIVQGEEFKVLLQNNKPGTWSWDFSVHICCMPDPAPPALQLVP